MVTASDTVESEEYFGEVSGKIYLDTDVLDQHQTDVHIWDVGICEIGLGDFKYFNELYNYKIAIDEGLITPLSDELLGITNSLSIDNYNPIPAKRELHRFFLARKHSTHKWC